MSANVCECIVRVSVCMGVCECVSRAPGVHSKLTHTDSQQQKHPRLSHVRLPWLRAGSSQMGPVTQRKGRGGFCATWTQEGEFERSGKTGQGGDVAGAKG